MTFVLLTGAGFSRNWGGWLASEAFEYLLGCPELNADVRHLLWKSRTGGGGFEDALAHLQQQFIRNPIRQTEKQLRDLEAAILGMFDAMNEAFANKTEFEPQYEREAKFPSDDSLVRRFLFKFDAIFTLNQDLLLERHYLNDNINQAQSQKWRGWQIPGTKPLPGSSPAALSSRAPDPSRFIVEPGLQPYFKLHGSSNWLTEIGEPNGRLLIMGGNKAVEINQYPLLGFYHDKFKECLSRSNARLMVVGYSFGDQHINEVIMQAADKGGLRLFIVDPQGVDVLDTKNQTSPVRVRSALQEQLEPRIFGASRRPLSTIFANDTVERAKVMKFFAP